MSRLPKVAHTARPWRIHELTRDFGIEDVWAFRTPGAGPDDFRAVLDAIESGGLGDMPWPAKVLFDVRWKLGALLGWDDASKGIGKRVASLRDRLPDDLRETVHATDDRFGPFKPVYELPSEAALEVANKTVHGVMHLSWVPGAHDDYELHMAVLVKPNGLLGRLYMPAIAPFRYLVVYPALTRRWEQAWRDRSERAL